MSSPGYRSSRAVGCMLLVALAAGRAQGHDGIHEQLVAISERIRADPGRASLYLERGELHRVHRAWAFAEADYDRARALDPTLAGVEPARVRMLLDARRLDAARAAARSWLDAHPADARVWLLEAEACGLQGALSEAVEAYTRAIASARVPLPEHYLARAAAQRELGPEGMADALAGLDEGIERLGSLVTLQLAAIDLQLQQGEFEGALARIERIRATAGRQEQWLARRGDVLWSAGRRDEAARAYGECLEHIDALKPRRRDTRLVRELARHARERLAEMAGGPCVATTLEQRGCR